MVSVQWLVAGCRALPIRWQQGMSAAIQHSWGSHPLFQSWQSEVVAGEAVLSGHVQWSVTAKSVLVGKNA